MRRDVAHVSTTLMHAKNISEDDTAARSDRANLWSTRIFVGPEQFALRREMFADVILVKT